MALSDLMSLRKTQSKEGIEAVFTISQERSDQYVTMVATLITNYKQLLVDVVRENMEEGEELSSLMGYLYKRIQPNKMVEEDEEKTGFHTEGVYCFTYMPKELKNSAATLQMMMEKTNEAEEAFRRIKRKLGKFPTLDIPKEGEDLLLCLRKKNKIISSVLLVEREGTQIPVSYVIILVWLRAIEEGIDCETLLAGLVASANQAIQRCEFSRKELDEFLSSISIPSEYSVILPTPTQTILDAPPGYIGFNIGSLFASINTEPVRADEEPAVKPMTEPAVEPTTEPVNERVRTIEDLGGIPKGDNFVVHAGSVAARIRERKCKTRGGSSRPPVKRKLASSSSTLRIVYAKASAIKDDTLMLSILDGDEVNRRSRELFKVIEKLRGEVDFMRARELAYEEEHEGLRTKCEDVITDFDKNPVVLLLREKMSSLAARESKVVGLSGEPFGFGVKGCTLAYMKLLHSDELGRLVGKLVSSAITFEWCGAYEQVARMKEPFNLLKAKGYRPSYEKEHTQASNDLATATFS
nr:hypothetical protein [Tanacetum cinerariifolium]